MPIYEWQCGANGHVFEMLASVGDSNGRKSCPDCGGKSRRVVSTFAIRGGRPTESASEKPTGPDDVTKLKLPNYARLCGMDDYSATRLAAHKVGRGAEFDDTIASREEKKAARGEVAPTLSAAQKKKPSHAHKSLTP